MLRDRASECRALDGLLDAARGGESGVLVLRGDPGVGKTALLEYATKSARDLHVVRAVGFESEMELAFAGLHQACAPILDRLERLPTPQRDALRAAFGLSTPGAPNRFIIGLAVLSLLSDVADEQPVLCVVDDTHSLDEASAQAFAFVARRLVAEPIAMLFATSKPSPELLGLPELRVQGLRSHHACELLRSAIAGPLDEHVRDRIVAETQGNPLALLELPRGLTPAELAGGFGLPAPLSGRIEESFRRRLESLPADSRQLSLIAAAEPVGEPALVWRAAARLGIGTQAADPADAAGLLEFGSRVRFHHPLARSAVYRAASAEERLTVHRALADATDPELDSDRRAWHRAHATSGPDEDVAAELVRSAGRAQARGGFAAAAAFLAKATELTIEPERRAQRALAAAEAKHEAGAPEAALRLLAAAEASPLDELQRVRVDLVRAQVAFAMNRGSDAPPLLLTAARELERLDLSLARETYLDAFAAATHVGRLADGPGIREVAQAACALPPPPQPPRASDLLLDGLALLISDGSAAGAPTLKRAVRAFRSEHVSRDEQMRWLWLAGHAALDVWDDESWFVLANRHVELAREAGALAILPVALNTRIGVHLSAGEFAAAGSLLEEVKAVAAATGTHLTPYIDLALAAFQGREAETLRLLDATRKEVLPRGEGIGLTIGEWATAVLYNGLGRYEDARAACGQAVDHPEDMRFFTRSLVELTEAAARTGDIDFATDALARLSESTRAAGTEFGLGTEARCRGLLSQGEAAERCYREAIDRLARTRVTTALARAHLVYGEWLRRERRRLDARAELRIAHERFTAMGMEAFARRAERELLATGERARKRSVETSGQLTPQETLIAQLARDGLSNANIGARLFISPRTVEYHLHKVFAKLDISSRSELEGAVSQS